MSEQELLSPERRFRLYTRIANIFHDAGMEDASKSARELAWQAARESPEIQAEIRAFMEKLREEAET